MRRLIGAGHQAVSQFKTVGPALIAFMQGNVSHLNPTGTLQLTGWLPKGVGGVKVMINQVFQGRSSARLVSSRVVLKN